MVNGFKIASDFQPAGDQPRAIAQLVEGYENGTWGFPRDKNRAGRYYLILKDRPEEQGQQIDVKLKIGTMYEYGWGGVAKDTAKACLFYSARKYGSHNNNAKDRTCVHA